MAASDGIEYAETHLAILTYIETCLGGNQLNQADIDTLFTRWANNGRPLVLAALDLIRILIADTDEPIQCVAELRAAVLAAMGTLE